MDQPDPDADLLPGLRAGQSTALSAMMDRHLYKIHALAFHMLGDNMLAEDVAQDSFIKLWQAAPTWREGEAQMMTWLRRVATNNCLDRLRKKGPVYVDQVPEIIDETPSPEIGVQNSDRSTVVQGALSKLPETQCAAIVLCYFQQLSQREGAEILGVSEKAYESLLVRARKALKAELTPYKMENVI